MISPTDTDFERVIDGTVMRHAVCAMERRLLNVDWISLVLDDLPALIGRHVSDYRMCFEKQGTAYGASGKLSVEQLFHLHQPHIALVSTSHAEEYVREWVDIVMGVMSVDHDGLLCDGDRDVMALRYLLREILTGVVSQALDKMSEPDYIYELVLVVGHGRLCIGLDSIHVMPIHSY